MCTHVIIIFNVMSERVSVYHLYDVCVPYVLVAICLLRVINNSKVTRSRLPCVYDFEEFDISMKRHVKLCVRIQYYIMTCDEFVFPIVRQRDDSIERNIIIDYIIILIAPFFFLFFFWGSVFDVSKYFIRKIHTD